MAALVESLIYALLYFVFAKTNLRLASVNPSATALWLPTGLAFSVLLLRGNRHWPAIFVGAFAANITTAGSLATSLAIAGGNTGEAVVGVWLVQRWANGCNAFDSAVDTFKFALLAGLCSTTLSPTVGVTSLCLGGYAGWDHYGAIWTTWWLGDVAGDWTVVPFVVLWNQRPTSVRALAAWLTHFEGVAYLGVMGIILGGAFFGAFPVNGRPIGSFLLPLVMWAAFRFTQAETAIVLVLIESVAVCATVNGHGPFVTPSLNDSLLLLQTFLGIISITATAVAADVTQRKYAEDALRRMQGELEHRVEHRTRALEKAKAELELSLEKLGRASLAKTNFLATMSHELRTPLNSILGFSEVLVTTPFEEMTPEHLETSLRHVHRSAEHLLGLINDLLDLTKIESGHLALQPEVVDVTQVVHVVADVLEPQVRRKRLQLRLPQEPCALEADPVRFRQILFNLLSNAVKFTPPAGTIEVHVEPAPDGVHIGVRDSGIGMSETDMTRLFEPYWQTGPMRSNPEEGSGLGLAITRRLVEAHGGSIQVESKEGQGSQFTVVLPVTSAAAAPHDITAS